jgi:hypothetical protein
MNLFPKETEILILQTLAALAVWLSSLATYVTCVMDRQKLHW